MGISFTMYLNGVISVFLFGILARISICQDIAPCESQIWCDGPLLHAVQMAELFPDSKTFVDMNLKEDPDVVLRRFEELRSNDELSKAELMKFVNQYFSGPGEELEQWTPTDLVENPAFLSRINDIQLRSFGKEMCKRWAYLGKKIKADVLEKPERYSLLYVPNPFIVPGGRFRETYYWDSYWVLKGLLTCEMTTTVKGMLLNFVHLVKTYGLIPNGGRNYFIRRSQPPLFLPMVDMYYEATRDVEFLRENIHYLEKEYRFWQTNRAVTISWNHNSNYRLNRYYVSVTKPRPESYREDVQAADGLSDAEKKELYSNLASACESGWDFSSRWSTQDPNETFSFNMTETRILVPVDLNSILCWNERLLSKFYRILGDEGGRRTYDMFHQQRKAAIEKVFWDDNYGSWFDYPLNLKTTLMKWQEFYPSNIFPMYTGCQKSSSMEDLEVRLLQYLKNEDVLNYEGGIPTSKHNDTGQQWDFPNAWPPLQDVIITSLGQSRSAENQKEALNIAQKWVYSNWLGWNGTRNMFEKYDVTKQGARGGGGEYGVQMGFGWTNGFVLDLLRKYGQSLTSVMGDDTSESTSGTPGARSINSLITAVVLLFINIFI